MSWDLPKNPAYEDFVKTYKDGKTEREVTVFYDELALAFLLVEGELCVDTVYDEDSDQSAAAITVSLNCNDTFAWGASDFEALEVRGLPEDIGDDNDLYTLLCAHLQDRRWGSLKWAARKRGCAPQAPIVRDMIRAGAWDDDLRQRFPEGTAAGEKLMTVAE